MMKNEQHCNVIFIYYKIYDKPYEARNYTDYEVEF